MSGPSDDALTGVAGDPPGTAATADSITETKPPSRRDAIIRIGIVAGVLSIVFGVILPRFVDYRQVLNALQGLSLQDFLVVGIFGLITWVLTGAIFTALIPGLGLVRGLDAYLILTGIGASIPLGPWNMAVLWVVIRGWGRPVSTTTGGILLYGIFDQLSRFGLMFIAGIVLVVAESAGRVAVENALIVGYLVLGGVLFVGLGVGLILVVRSERLARKLGHLAERDHRRRPPPVRAGGARCRGRARPVPGHPRGHGPGARPRAPSSWRWPRSSGGSC